MSAKKGKSWNLVLFLRVDVGPDVEVGEQHEEEDAVGCDVVSQLE